MVVFIEVWEQVSSALQDNSAFYANPISAIVWIFLILLLIFSFPPVFGPISWGCQIRWLLLCTEVRLPNECSGYDTKQSDGEAPVMLELGGMLSILYCHHSQIQSDLEW